MFFRAKQNDLKKEIFQQNDVSGGENILKI